MHLPPGIALAVYRIVQESLAWRSSARPATAPKRSRPCGGCAARGADGHQDAAPGRRRGHQDAASRRRPGAHPKILILTTFHLDEYVTEALSAGASGFLLKEATADQLIEAVRVIASGEAILAPSVTQRLLERMAEDSAGDGGQQIRDLLSAREADVLLLVARRLSNAEIGAKLHLAETTVKSHVQSMLGKLGVRDRLQAAVAAYDAGLVRPRGS